MTTRYTLHSRVPVPEPNLLKWASWFERAGADRVVARTEVAEVTVSTVFLGLDHRFVCKGPPLLFETAIFVPDDSGDVVERYATWGEAEAGHKRAVAELEEAGRKAWAEFAPIAARRSTARASAR